MKKLVIISFMMLFFSVNLFSQTGNWDIDLSHYKVGFSVSHMVISDVEGRFTEFTASAVTKKDGSLEKIEATINIKSVNTDNQKRDDHLRSDDFFASEKYPEMKFVSKSIQNKGGNKFKITGDLTIRNVTKSVVLDAQLNGTVKDPWGNTRMGWKASTKINRFDYGLNWNSLLEAGGLVVGKEVTINLEAEFMLKK